MNFLFLLPVARLSLFCPASLMRPRRAGCEVLFGGKLNETFPFFLFLSWTFRFRSFVLDSYVVDFLSRLPRLRLSICLGAAALSL